MIDLCELMERDPIEARKLIDELLSVHARQIAMRPIDYKEPPEGFPCATAFSK